MPLCTHKEIRYAKTILLIGGEPEEEQTFTAKQIRQAVRNGGAKLIVVNETPIRLTAQASTVYSRQSESFDAFALALPIRQMASWPKNSASKARRSTTLLKTIGETEGDFVIMFGGDLSPEAQAVLANSAANFASDNRRVLLHPLPLYNNSVGANDMTPGKKIACGSVEKFESACSIGGSLAGS